MRKYNNRPLFLISSITIIEILPHLIIFFALLLQLNQILSRAKIGFGLTDEAYGLSYTIDRAKNGQTASTALFADVTSPFLSLVNFNIYYFRLVGIVAIGLLCVLIHGYRLVAKESCQKDSKVFATLLLTSIIFTIPMNFRYLLITPSYQWIVLVFSILAVILSLIIINLKSKSYILQTLLGTSMFAVTLARPTSGVMIWLLVNIYFFSTKHINKYKRILLLNLILIILLTSYIKLNWIAVKSFASRYMFLINLDPEGSNLINEISDVAFALIYIWFIFFFGQVVAKFVLKPHRIDFFSKRSRSFILMATLSIYPIWHIAFLYRDFPHLLLSIYAFSLGALTSFRKSKVLNIPMLLLSSAPILTQFGSNTSASYLTSPFLISLTVYSLLGSDEPLGRRVISNDFKNQNKQNGVKILLALSLILLVSSHSKVSYETHLPQKQLVMDPVSSLAYSSQKLERMQEFRRNAEVSGEFSGQHILDLSFWHPGVILYLGGLQFPFSLDNKVFRDTIDIQVRSIISQVKSKGSDFVPPVIVETSEVVPTKKCSKLTEYIEDIRLKSLLIENGFNPEMYNSSIYVSDTIDITLFPKNVAYLVPCRPGS